MRDIFDVLDQWYATPVMSDEVRSIEDRLLREYDGLSDTINVSRKEYESLCAYTREWEMYRWRVWGEQPMPYEKNILLDVGSKFVVVKTDA